MTQIEKKQEELIKHYEDYFENHHEDTFYLMDWVQKIEKLKSELAELKVQGTIGEVYDKEPIEKFLGEVPSEQQPKGAEVILEPFIRMANDNDQYPFPYVRPSCALKAMQEYRLQGLREELMNFAIECNVSRIKEMITQVEVDEYLKQLPNHKQMTRDEYQKGWDHGYEAGLEVDKSDL
jgi:hypothetical protein